MHNHDSYYAPSRSMHYLAPRDGSADPIGRLMTRESWRSPFRNGPFRPTFGKNPNGDKRNLAVVRVKRPIWQSFPWPSPNVTFPTSRPWVFSATVRKTYAFQLIACSNYLGPRACRQASAEFGDDSQRSRRGIAT